MRTAFAEKFLDLPNLFEFFELLFENRALRRLRRDDIRFIPEVLLAGSQLSGRDRRLGFRPKKLAVQDQLLRDAAPVHLRCADQFEHAVDTEWRQLSGLLSPTIGQPDLGRSGGNVPRPGT